MDPRDVEDLAQRLIVNPLDQEARDYAHQAGASDPQGYAALLERVGRETPDPAYASYWLSEAANVFAITLGDAHHAAEVLLLAVVKDPTQDLAADRLAQLYREKSDVKALAALLEKRAKMLAPIATQEPSFLPKLAAMHEELGTLWAEPPLADAARALANYRRAFEIDPQSVFAIYSARELLKQSQRWAEAVPLFAMEQAIATDPERKVALLRDEAEVRRQANDLAGVVNTLRTLLRGVSADDPALWQELGSAILDRVRAGEAVASEDREEGAAQFVRLAETYDGEHGFAYSTLALELLPGNDRAVQLASYYGDQIDRAGELASAWQSYLAANPEGVMAPDVQGRLEAAGLPATPPASPAPRLREPSAPENEPLRAPSSPQASEPAPSAHAEAHRSQSEPSALRSHEPLDPVRLSQLLDAAQQYATKRLVKEALQTYTEVLQMDPVSPEALSWVDEHLRSKRKFAELRDVYQNAARVATIGPDVRKKFLSNVANICEQQLRDIDGAIQALKQASQIDSSVRDNLRRLLEKGQRWDDLAVLIDQEVMDAPDSEVQITLLKKLAALHEQKRKDAVGAGEAWARLAALMPGDDGPINAAVKLFERGNRLDLAAEVIADNAGGIDNPGTHTTLLMRLGDLREKSNDKGGAGDAYAEAAELGAGAKAWEHAQKVWEAVERWEDAARAAGQRAALEGDPKHQAALLACEADFHSRAGDPASAILRLEEAADLDPTDDIFAAALEGRYQEAERLEDLAQFLLRRATKLSDSKRRVALRKRAADMLRDKLSDLDAARETMLLVLEDGDDAATLTFLADDSRARGDFQDEAALLHRLAAVTDDKPARTQIVLREAAVLASDLNDADSAVAAYESVLESLDAGSTVALAAIADLEEGRENWTGAVAALERRLKLLSAPEEKLEIARRLADLYQNRIDDKPGAIRALEAVHAADPEDFDAISRLVELCEATEAWERTAALLAKLLEVEGDPSEISSLARRMAELMDQRLGRGQEALAVLEPQADEGDEECRNAYVEIGDRLNFKGIVAMKLRDWYALAPAAKQHEAFRGAFDRFAEMGRNADAAQVAVELIRSKGATPEIVQKLEELATKAKDLDSLGTAHDLMARDVSGVERAVEYVRQAEVLVAAGVDPVEASNHGEQGLASVPASEVGALLQRLAGILPASSNVVDLYERQVGRCKAPADRLAALARAAQVAADRGAHERVKSLFELALGGAIKEDTIELLEKAAAEGDAQRGSKDLRSALAHAMASGSSGLRDGGRTRASMLRRAALVAFRELGDIEKAFEWMGEALITHVEPASLDALELLAEEVGDLRRAEIAIEKALEQVFDGPLVRQLVARRAELRRTKLGDLRGAADDLKRLHDLAPSDKTITDDLYGLLKQLRDFRGMVQLLEDQILRGKDPPQRAELARRAARLWEERLEDPREAADAWRRVLRMKPGDDEAQAGLERAKTNLLKKPESMLPPMPEELAPVVLPPPPPALEAMLADELAEPTPVPALADAVVDDEVADDDAHDTLPPPAIEEAESLPEAKLERPDISLHRHEELTLSTPIGALLAAVGAGDDGASDTSAYIEDDLIESLDEIESVGDDELLDLEPGAIVQDSTAGEFDKH